jgi:hypothetical protein
MNRKSIWDKFSDLEFVEGALEGLDIFTEDSATERARTLLLTLKARLKEGARGDK